MQLGRLGVWYPTDRLDAASLAYYVKRVEALGYSSIWYPESTGYESFALASYLLQQSRNLTIGSSIANLYARDPVTARNGLYTLSQQSGNRFILGLGVSHKPNVEGVRGHIYDKPVPTMRAYLEVIAKASDSAAASRPVMIAALGPGMLKLAASHAWGALPYNVTPEHTRRARAALGSDKWLVVEQMVCLSDDLERARKAKRQELARYMVLDNYRNNWLSLGFSEQDLAQGGNDRFLDAMVASGGVAAIRARLDEHFAAGANQVAIQPIHPELKPEIDWRCLEALAPGG